MHTHVEVYWYIIPQYTTKNNKTGGNLWGLLPVFFLAASPCHAAASDGDWPKDTFAEARDNDVQNLAEEMEAEIQQDSGLDAEEPPALSLWDYSTHLHETDTNLFCCLNPTPLILEHVFH